MKKKWTKEELTEHLKINIKDYGAAIPVAAMYLKMYGELPKMGLSGFQGENAEILANLLPTTKNSE